MDEEQAKEIREMVLLELSKIGMHWADIGMKIRQENGTDSVEFFVAAEIGKSLAMVLGILSGQIKYSDLVNRMKQAKVEIEAQQRTLRNPIAGQGWQSLN